MRGSIYVSEWILNVRACFDFRTKENWGARTVLKYTTDIETMKMPTRDVAGETKTVQGGASGTIN